MGRPQAGGLNRLQEVSAASHKGFYEGLCGWVGEKRCGEELVWVGGGGLPSPTLPSPAPPASCKPEAGCWAASGQAQGTTLVLRICHRQGT